MSTAAEPPEAGRGVCAPGAVLTSQIGAEPLAGADSATEVIGEDPAEWQSEITFTHSLGLALDEDSERRVDTIRAALRRAGVPVLGYPGHITLCCVDSIAEVDADLLDVGMPRRLRLPFARLLPGESGVVALCLDPGPAHREDGTPPSGASARSDPHGLALRRAHRLLHRRLAARGITAFNFYAPPAWSPHISIGFHVPEPLRREAVRIVAGFGPVDVGFSGITVWTISTDEQDLLVRF